MKKSLRAIIICLIMIFCCSTSTFTASANSAQSHWTGVDSTGLIVTEQDCPIIVEKELLTFDIAEFPKNYYDTLDEYMAYSAKVTAEYTFYNPADYSVTATLVFPFGNIPDYAHDYYDEVSESYVIANDTDKYNILVNGTQIEKRVRHTLFDRYDQFNAAEDIPLLCDGFVTDPFYAPDMVVTKYQYEISGVDGENYPAATVAMDIGRFNGKTKVMFLEQHGSHTQKDGDVRIGASVDNGDVITVYIFGDQNYQLPEWKFYKNGGVEDKEEIDGVATLVSKGTETMTFKEFALTAYKADSGVSESDWYNAMVADLNRYKTDAAYVNSSERDFDLSNSLMRWYEYEIIAAPGERISNVVEAPIYPSIDLNYNPDVFKYQYLLSPAKCWASFGNLEILVNTPYFITESNIEGVIKTENGYKWSLDGLPDGELNFTMSTTENPEKPGFKVTNYLPIEMIISFSVIGVIFIVGGIVVFVIFRKKKRSRNAK